MKSSLSQKDEKDFVLKASRGLGQQVWDVLLRELRKGEPKKRLQVRNLDDSNQHGFVAFQ